MFYLRRSEIGNADLQLGFCAGCFSLCKHNPICLWSPGTAWRKAALIGVHAFMQTLHSAGVRSTNQPPEKKKNILEKDISKTAFSHLWNTFKSWPPAGWPKRVSTVWDLLTPLSAGNQAHLNLHNLLKTLTSAREKANDAAINSVAWLNLHHGKMGHETRHPAIETRGKGKAQLPQLYLGTLVLRYAQWNRSLQGERRY